MDRKVAIVFYILTDYWVIYAAGMVICDLITWGIIFSHRVNLKLALRFHALLIVTILSFQINGSNE